MTVTALTKYIKYKFDNDRHLLNVLLEGEISNFKRHSRGHFYFTLKDDHASISAMMFQSNASKVLFDPKDGQHVFVRGTLSVYEAAGTYQIIVNQMKLDGMGDLYQAYEKLKKELESAGLFDQRHKKKIPNIPSTVGVITSPTGAAVHDIINTITRRFPICKIILYPALVQGEGAKESIVHQIEKANKDALCDVLIVGRGGGSIEDLWAFNEKVVAMAIFDSNIPIISSVGHEVDFTIADFVADVRAATPTAAAEIATPNKVELKEKIDSLVNQMTKQIISFMESKKILLANLDRHLDNNNPIEKVKQKKQEIIDLQKKVKLLTDHIIEGKKNEFLFLETRLNPQISSILTYKNNQFQILKEKLEALSPLTIMDKGYSIVSKENKVVKSIKDLSINEEVSIKLKDGSSRCKVMEVISNGK